MGVSNSVKAEERLRTHTLRRRNGQNVRHSYLFLKMDDKIEWSSEENYFYTFDAKCGFWNVDIKEEEN